MVINELEHENYARSLYVYRLTQNFNLEPIFYVFVKQFSHHSDTQRSGEEVWTDLHLELGSLWKGRS